MGPEASISKKPLDKADEGAALLVAQARSLVPGVGVVRAVGGRGSRVLGVQGVVVGLIVKVRRFCPHTP